MRNIALILGACAVAVQANRALYNSARGSTQTDEAAQKNSYMPVESDTSQDSAPVSNSDPVYNVDPVSNSGTVYRHSYQMPFNSILPVQEIKQAVKNVARNVYNQPKQEYFVESPNSLFSSFQQFGSSRNFQVKSYLPAITDPKYSWVEAKSVFEPTTLQAATSTKAPAVVQQTTYMSERKPLMMNAYTKYAQPQPQRWLQPERQVYGTVNVNKQQSVYRPSTGEQPVVHAQILNQKPVVQAPNFVQEKSMMDEAAEEYAEKADDVEDEAKFRSEDFTVFEAEAEVKAESKAEVEAQHQAAEEWISPGAVEIEAEVGAEAETSEYTYSYLDAFKNHFIFEDIYEDEDVGVEGAVEAEIKAESESEIEAESEPEVKAQQQAAEEWISPVDPNSYQLARPHNSILPVQEIKQAVKPVAHDVYNQPEQEYIVGSPNSLFSWSSQGEVGVESETEIAESEAEVEAQQKAAEEWIFPGRAEIEAEVETEAGAEIELAEFDAEVETEVGAEVKAQKHAPQEWIRKFLVWDLVLG